MWQMLEKECECGTLVMALTSVDSFCFLNKKQLVNLRIKAMRSGAWFKALQRIDRVLFDLTIRVVDNIRSAKLAKSIGELTRKLEDAAKNSFSSRLKKIGLPMAQKISLTAQKFGNVSAGSWVFDSSFAIFLAVMHVNNVEIFKR
jgi:predicted transcriptional regulator